MTPNPRDFKTLRNQGSIQTPCTRARVCTSVRAHTHTHTHTRMHTRTHTHTHACTHAHTRTHTHTHTASFSQSVKNQNKSQILKITEGKEDMLNSKVRITADLHAETMKARRKWSNTFKIAEKSTHNFIPRQNIFRKK